MTRQRKEIRRELELLEREQMEEYELSYGFFQEEIEQAFSPRRRRLQEKLAMTYGKSVKELDERIFEAENEAYEAGRIHWAPCYGTAY